MQMLTRAGKPIARENLFKYTNGRFLVNENYACDRRHVKFDVDALRGSRVRRATLACPRD
jgi:hypothetical protein